MGAVVAQRGEGVVARCVAGGIVEHLYFGIFLAPLTRQACGGFLGEFNPRADGKLEVYAESRIVGRREKLRAHIF